MRVIAYSIIYFLIFIIRYPAFAGTWNIESFKTMNGSRTYKVYVPTSLDTKKAPALVLMLHGCQQSADDFARGTRIEKWAEKEGFIALLPEQNLAYNPFKCWNWIIPANNSRIGESQFLANLIDHVATQFGADTQKIFAVGMSAGASMVNILGNCYPEKFKALASHDGTQFLSSYTGLDFAEVVLNGANVPSGISAYTGHLCSNHIANRPNRMPIIIFHGMKSPLMSPTHAFQIENQMKAFNDYLDNGLRDNSYFLEKTVESVPETDRYGYNLYKTINANHEVVVERYMINNLSHAWSGGVESLPYNDPHGPDATAFVINFFKNYGL